MMNNPGCEAQLKLETDRQTPPPPRNNTIPSSKAIAPVWMLIEIYLVEKLQWIFIRYRKIVN